ncbi:MAG: NADH-quinone oxidoreductase subunit L [Actinomycetota bacterium]
MLSSVWLIPVLPLAAAVINLLLGKRLGRFAGLLASGVMLAAFALGLGILFDLLSLPGEERLHIVRGWEWIASGSFEVGVDLRVDPLAVTMLLVITGVGSLIHIYSIGYMAHDPRGSRFFAYMNLFVFFMLMLVLAENFLLLYLGWEGVGLCSYLLIGFWFDKTDAANAAKKAFITTRIGDVALLLGIVLVWVHFGSLDFSVVFEQGGAAARLTTGAATAIALLLLGGAIGKSAQVPLHVWLPDAMEGPTPVSALIHAATMVTAGVYLVVRSHTIFETSGTALTVTMVVGLVSAIYAGFASIGQYDLKRALAYSTMSQLGFMFFAAGMGFYGGAMLLLVCHAFYKALLFLSAGSVMHGLNDETDMRKMGGLRAEMPVTSTMFIIGAFALSGLPPLAGFFAKDHIVNFASSSGRTWAYVLASGGAFLSALYIFRPVFIAFLGSKRYEGHAHESPPVMTAPLGILAIGAIFGGVLGLSAENGLLERFLEPVIGHPASAHLGPPESTLIAISVALVLLALGLAWYLWSSGRYDWLSFPQRQPFSAEALRTGFFVNPGYAWAVEHWGKGGARALAWFDTQVIDGAVNGVGAIARRASRISPIWEAGLVRVYAASFAIGAVAILFVLGLRS